MWTSRGSNIPPLVTQIADGENGGVMMNEFPPKYMEVGAEASGSDVPSINVTEYLNTSPRRGSRERFPAYRAVLQKRIWDSFKNGEGPEKLEKVISDLKKQDGRFHMEGGSWTKNISWVKGYENILGQWKRPVRLFYERTRNVPDYDPGIS